MRLNTILAFLFLVITTSCANEKRKPLPIYNPSNFNPKLVDKSLHNSSTHHTVLDFKLINQNGDTITQDHYKDKIYVTDFFFTRCGTICPIMSDNMAKIQNEFLNDDEIMLLSLSVTPYIDSVSVLREYANRKGAIDSKWHLTTGHKKHIYDLARKSYFAVVEQGDGGLQDFIHTPNFILVDKKKQIRGIYDGTQDEDIEQLITDIRTLKH
ncbi:protein SCO1/2 [Winogradskyella epiphytica]|uniref:Protein SCO1/2 n=1 Tax=Winogradskyella epiphytica TaxID=262005 RepID=A0A2V4WVY0_9FLAO|nr:protein SCO1/2 [Winogradskyella epiphytica]GGW66928.1 SCO family protein [Winogradskyella epiphytica]